MRRIIAIFALAVVVTATAQLPASAAAGAPRVFFIDGHGWGHGRGMGQYGARALAAAGTRWDRILFKYYTDVKWAKVNSNQHIRVLLQHAKSIVVKGDSRALLVSGRTAVASTKRGAVYYLIGRAGSKTTVSVSTSADGPWRKVAAIRTPLIRVTGARQAGIVGSPALRWYRGSLEIVPSGQGINVINNVDLETYVSEVVPREMPSTWPIDALRAQAVAARTYVLRVAAVARANHRGYDICATTACQVFGGYAWTKNGVYQVLEAGSARAAALSTAGYIMTFNGKPILAEYSSSTGGYTTSGGVPYLAPRPDPWDAAAPLHNWTETVSAWEIQQRWPVAGAVRDVRVIARDGRGDFGGRALRLAIVGSRGTITVSGSSFEAAFDLPSDWFRFRPAPGAKTQYRFTFDMGKGTRNVAVLYLQQRLRAAGFFPASTPFTTYFGPITESALQRYQRANRISATGFLGPATRARLNATK